MKSRGPIQTGESQSASLALGSGPSERPEPELRLASLETWGPLLKNPALWVAALGYFVDLFDLILFGVYRVQSLRDLGLNDEQIFTVGARLLNLQMAGMLVGGFAWGILGDRRGRLSVLFGSIACYSVANLLNAFVTDVTAYGILRFVSGFGLAGEFGAAVTLIAESLPKRSRGLGTTLIAAIGFTGAMTAASLSHFLYWRYGFALGGVLGLGLLFLRFKMRESPMYQAAREKAPPSERGRALWLLIDPRLRSRYLFCLMVGVPVYFVAGIVMTFAPEIARDLGIVGDVSAGTTILLGYAGSTVGDFLSGIISQKMRSRKQAIFGFLFLDLALVGILYFLLPGKPALWFHAFALLIGFANGYWALFAVVASEQFGTNLRSTVTTSLTNLVRGFTVPMTIGFLALRGDLGVKLSASVIGVAVVTIAILAASRLRETFHADLDYLEKRSS